MSLAASSATVPGRLRVADIDHDGYPDIVATIANKDLTTSTHLYMNVA